MLVAHVFKVGTQFQLCLDSFFENCLVEVFSQ